MEFSPEEVLERLEVYGTFAYRIKELKDLLLDFDIYGDEELIETSMRHQDDLVAEIRMIYHQKMLPILGDLACYISENMPILDMSAGIAPEEASGYEAEDVIDEMDRSKGVALDMGSSLLTSIIDNMNETHNK